MPASLQTSRLGKRNKERAAGQGADVVRPLSHFKDHLDPVVRINSSGGILVGVTTQGSQNLLTPALFMPSAQLTSTPVTRGDPIARRAAWPTWWMAQVASSTSMPATCPISPSVAWR